MIISSYFLNLNGKLITLLEFLFYSTLEWKHRDLSLYLPVSGRFGTFLEFCMIIRLFIVLLLISLPFITSCYSAPLSGSIKEEQYIEQGKSGVIVDSLTGHPISNATVGIPSKGVFVKTNGKGEFSFNAQLSGPAILSVEADGYKPYSLTVGQEGVNGPLNIAISKESGKEIIIDSALHHLGDDNFSVESANAADFKKNSVGPYFSRTFYIDSVPQNSTVILRIGSIIGVDTEIARKLKQTNVTSSVSSPVNVYLNSKKVGEIKINGDNQEIIVPGRFLIQNAPNEITFETGRNLASVRKVDYDDMEFINLILEFR